jgi:hypothetical protein
MPLFARSFSRSSRTAASSGWCHVLPAGSSSAPSQRSDSIGGPGPNSSVLSVIIISAADIEMGLAYEEKKEQNGHNQ